MARRSPCQVNTAISTSSQCCHCKSGQSLQTGLGALWSSRLNIKQALAQRDNTWKYSEITWKEDLIGTKVKSSRRSTKSVPEHLVHHGHIEFSAQSSGELFNNNLIVTLCKIIVSIQYSLRQRQPLPWCMCRFNIRSSEGEQRKVLDCNRENEFEYVTHFWVTRKK